MLTNPHSVLNVKALVGAFNRGKALVGLIMIVIVCIENGMEFDSCLDIFTAFL